MTAKTLDTTRPSVAGAMIVGTGLAFASIILLPAVATQIGVSATLTGALRIALMRASSRVVSAGNQGGDSVPASISCH
jgi:hypothetical protein